MGIVDRRSAFPRQNVDAFRWGLLMESRRGRWIDCRVTICLRFDPALRCRLGVEFCRRPRLRPGASPFCEWERSSWDEERWFVPRSRWLTTLPRLDGGRRTMRQWVAEEAGPSRTKWLARGRRLWPQGNRVRHRVVEVPSRSDSASGERIRQWKE